MICKYVIRKYMIDKYRVRQKRRAFLKKNHYIINFSFKIFLLPSMCLYWINIWDVENIPHVVSVFIDAFLKMFLEVGLHSFQHCSVDLGDFLQIVYGAYSHTHVPWGFPTRNNHAWTSQGRPRGQGVPANLEMRRSLKRERITSIDDLDVWVDTPSF